MEAVRQVALRRGESQVVAKDVEPALLARAPQMVVVGALRRGEK
jgi:hypothetical protein